MSWLRRMFLATFSLSSSLYFGQSTETSAHSSGFRENLEDGALTLATFSRTREPCGTRSSSADSLSGCTAKTCTTSFVVDLSSRGGLAASASSITASLGGRGGRLRFAALVAEEELVPPACVSGGGAICLSRGGWSGDTMPSMPTFREAGDRDEVRLVERPFAADTAFAGDAILLRSRGRDVELVLDPNAVADTDADAAGSETALDDAEDERCALGPTFCIFARRDSPLFRSRLTPSTPDELFFD
mmetsp:Transcript_3776/g.11254  ORF Transcript_3776/g.11254 Transcript_3776/m.11254 type:complete len:245 (-) Transcript_3776:550-1284(-)